MSKLQNNKELVRVGHEFARAMGADTPLIEIAKMVSRLAEQLDCTTAALHGTQELRDQLAAENAALKAFGGKLGDMHNDLNGEGTGIQGRAEVAIQQVALEAAIEEFDAIKTPATDAFLAELRNEAGARAVELFAQTLGSPYSVRDEKCYEDGFTRAIEVVRDAQAPRFAAKLRHVGAA